MADRIRGLEWINEPAGRDLHVLPGHATRPFLPDLRVRIAKLPPAFDDDLVDVPTYVAGSGATFTFVPLFNALKVNDDWVGFGANGLTVNAKTGVVTLPATPPSPLKRNFLVEAVLTLPGGTILREVVRIHVHLGVVRAWLTPPEISVRKSGTIKADVGARFSVRAEFDDGVVGDLTLNHGVFWTAAKPGRVTAEGFLRPDATDPDNDGIDITATLPAALGAKVTDPAKLRVLPAWTSDPALPTVTSMTGGGSPLANAPERTPNVLIVSCGFEKPHEPAFVTITDLILEQLRTDPINRPFNLLATSINFWRVFLPAPMVGVSWREEIYVTGPAGVNRDAHPMPAPARPPDTGAWNSVAHLLYVAGLPMPDDADRPAAAVRPALASMVSTDHTLRINDAAIVPDTLIDDWVKLANRSMVDEIDGFPAVQLGVPPAASTAGSTMHALHADRGGLPAMQDFLRALSADDGTTAPPAAKIGEIWAEHKPASWRFDNTLLVTLLSSYPGGRPLNSHPFIALGLDRQRPDVFAVAKAPGRNAYTLVPKVPVRAARHQTRLFAHELAHSLGIGDEYREFPGKDPEVDARDLNFYANLQYESAVRTGPGGALQSASIKWNWHRIRDAAVVEGAITAGPAAGQFTVPVAPPQGLIFNAGDRVLLRYRAWHRPLGETPSAPLDRAHEATVVSVAAASIVITASASATLALADLNRFTPGSLIYAPVVAPPALATPQYQYLELVAKNVRDYIDAKNLPLTPVPCVPDSSTFTWPLLPLVNLKHGFCGLCHPEIVGLYSGGNRYACGVFHPAGECAMGPSRPDEAKPFCAVCRYALVDVVDPTMHGALDRIYAKVYPQS